MVMVNVVRNPKVARWGAMAVLTAAVFGASAGLQQAAESAPPLPEKKLTFRDIQLSVHARKALADDPDLGPLNLGVRVQDNTAFLWGPAPSEALKRRAVDIVKKVKGVFSVKDADVYIAAPTVAVETAEATPPGPPEAPTHTEAASPPESVAALTARPAAEASPPEVVLRAPLPPEGAGPARTVSAAPPDGLAAAVAQARQTEERFRQIDCRLAGDMVILRPGSGRGEDVMAFARAISRLPGLTRIVIESDGDAPR